MRERAKQTKWDLIYIECINYVSGVQNKNDKISAMSECSYFSNGKIPVAWFDCGVLF